MFKKEIRKQATWCKLLSEYILDQMIGYKNGQPACNTHGTCFANTCNMINKHINNNKVNRHYRVTANAYGRDLENECLKRVSKCLDNSLIIENEK